MVFKIGKKHKEKVELEDKISRFLNSSNRYFEKDFELGKRFYSAAHKLYGGYLDSYKYNEELDIKINSTFRQYYNPKIFVDKK